MIEQKFMRLERDTLGSILKTIRHYIKIDQETEKAFSRLLDIRNELAHDFFRKHDINHLSVNGRAIMAKELHSHINYLYSWHMRIEELYDPLYEKLGMTQAMKEKAMEEMVKLAP